MENKYIMPRSAKTVSEAQRLISRLVGQEIKNEILKLSGTLSNKSIKKMGSLEAVGSSTSARLHAKAVANVDILFSRADFDVTHADNTGDIDIQLIHRLGTLMFDEETCRYIPIMITVKEFVYEPDNRIYTIEAIDIYETKDSAEAWFKLTDEPDLATESKAPNSAGHTSGSNAPRRQKHDDGKSFPNTEFNNKIIDLLEKVNKNKN